MDMMKPKKKKPVAPKPKPKKPAATSFGQIGGALPPPPTAAEMKKMSGRGNLYVPGTMKAKPKAPPRGGITGFKSRKRLMDEAMGR